MISQDAIPGEVKYLKDAVDSIKRRQIVDASSAQLVFSYGSGGGAPSWNWDYSFFVPEYDYKLIRVVWTPSVTPPPYAEIDVRSNLSFDIYAETYYEFYPDPNSANRTDRTSWIIFAYSIAFGGANVSVLSRVRSTVTGTITYEVIR